MYLDSWACQCTYQAFKEVLSSGICHHLQVGPGWLCWGGCQGSARPVLVSADRPLLPQNNELLREIFGLGSPLLLDAAALKASKVSRFKKVGAATHICAHSALLCCHGLQLSA